MRISLGLELFEVGSGLVQPLLDLREEALRILWKEIASAGQDNLLIIQLPFVKEPYIVVGPTFAAIDCLRSGRLIAWCLLDRGLAVACSRWCRLSSFRLLFVGLLPGLIGGGKPASFLAGAAEFQAEPLLSTFQVVFEDELLLPSFWPAGAPRRCTTDRRLCGLTGFATDRRLCGLAGFALG